MKRRKLPNLAVATAALSLVGFTALTATAAKAAPTHNRVISAMDRPAQPYIRLANPVRGLHATESTVHQSGPTIITNLPTYTDCRAHFLYCMTPKMVREVYGLSPYLAADKRGQSYNIVLIEAYGSPSLTGDVATFDRQFGIDRAHLRILQPLGSVAYDPSNTFQQSWYAETSMDVEMAQAIAPDATINVLEAPEDTFNDFYGLLEYTLGHKLGRIVSQSWGTAEPNGLNGTGSHSLRTVFDGIYASMKSDGDLVLASTGDRGSANFNNQGQLIDTPTVNYPASSPYVLGVGGTSLAVTSAGARISEKVWDNEYGASGGGVSKYFLEPSWQKLMSANVQSRLDGHRGVADVSFDADPESGMWFYCSTGAECRNFGSEAGFPGWSLAGGTSEGAPAWAGIAADLSSVANRPIGPLLPVIYPLGHNHQGFVDITSGQNSFDNVPGFDATPGWDSPTGFGTPNAALYSAIINATKS